MKPRDELIRLTVNHKTGEVILNLNGKGAFGRSAYLCFSQACFAKAEKGNRLRQALQGRRPRSKQSENSKPPGVLSPRTPDKEADSTQTPKQRQDEKIRFSWPLEPQLIKVVSELCAEHDKNMPKY